MFAAAFAAIAALQMILLSKNDVTVFTHVVIFWL